MGAATDPPALNRNDACPCGSGKKYKKCCMGRVVAARRAAPPARPELKPLLRRALDHQTAGRLAAAKTLYEQAVESYPKNADALFGLGQIQDSLGRLEEGVRLVRLAIAADGRRSRFHAKLAMLLLDTGRPDEAMESARRASALDPGNAAPLTVMAMCHERMNRLDEAAEAARKAIALNPDETPSGVVLARVQRRRADYDTARATLEAFLARERIPIRRARLLHELALDLDRLGEHASAFAALEECGAADARSPAAQRVDPTKWSALIEQYRAGTSREHFDRWPRESFDDRRPIPAFLVGFPRSGTTMTEQILAAHAAVVTAEEAPIIHAVATELGRMFPDHDDVTGMLTALDHEGAARLRDLYRRETAARLAAAPNAEVLLDKLPLNIVHLPLINSIFPEARVIVALPDPRDVCLSCLMQDFALNDAMINFLSLEGTTRFYAEVMGLWLHIREVLTLDFLEVRYEDTVRDLPAQARRMLDRLGVAWDPAVLDFHERARDTLIQTPSYAAVTEKAHTRAIGRWRNYEAQMKPTLDRLAPFVKAFGYE